MLSGEEREANTANEIWGLQPAAAQDL